MSNVQYYKVPLFCTLVIIWICLILTPFTAAQAIRGESGASAGLTGGIYPSSVSIYAHPVFTIPMLDSTEFFGPGAALGLGVEYSFQGNPQLFLSGGLDYAFLTVNDESSSVSLISMLAGGGVHFWFTPRLGVRVTGLGGYYYGFLNDGGSAGGQLALQGGAQLEYLLTPAIDLALGAAYRYDLGTFQGLSVTASTSFFTNGTEGRRLAIKQAQQSRRPDLLDAKTPEKGRGLELADVELYEIYPVFHKFYDDHPVGTALLINQEPNSVTDIKLTFFIKQYMDTPKQCPVPEELTGGGSETVEIMSLLTDLVLEVTESTKVAAKLSLEYRMDGELYRDTRTVTVRLLDRNAMSWDDDRKAAAFVTAKDPTVLTVSKSVAGMAREQGTAALNLNLLTAMGMFSTMELYGLSYVVDPKTPFVEFSKNETLIDYLQFPRQTLEYKAGDCDDLSILFAALLESVGVETAFVTVPGHIFLAFSTGLSADEAARVFQSDKQLIIQSGEAWVPVETTVRKGGFMKAWAEAARQWREASSRDSAGFYPVHSAWREYEPVGLPGEAGEIDLPGDAPVLSMFQQEVKRFVDQEIAPQVAQLEERIRKEGAEASTRNKLGILYARYGRYQEAETEFLQVVEEKAYLPSLINLGNLALLQGEADQARVYYERGAEQDPDNPKVLLALSQVYHNLGQYEMARARYAELSKVNPPLAERYAYLGGAAETSGRASEVDSRQRQILWAE